MSDRCAYMYVGNTNQAEHLEVIHIRGDRVGPVDELFFCFSLPNFVELS